jgi:hypothetical protein
MFVWLAGFVYFSHIYFNRAGTEKKQPSIIDIWTCVANRKESYFCIQPAVEIFFPPIPLATCCGLVGHIINNNLDSFNWARDKYTPDLKMHAP